MKDKKTTHDTPIKHISEDMGTLVHREKDGTIVWGMNNKEITPVKSFQCLIPLKIQKVMLEINRHFTSVEFSIFTKVEFCSEKKVFVMGEEFYIPEQEVSGAAITYKGDNLDFNCVIHKHPNNCMSFSGTDQQYINRNFEFSFLWVNSNFHIGIHNKHIEDLGTRVVIDIKPVVEEENTTYVPAEMLNKIKKHQPAPTQLFGPAPADFKAICKEERESRKEIVNRIKRCRDIRDLEDDIDDFFGSL